jgi:hypothetical protein
MPVARHPPHRSLHEELPHRAPTSGNNAQALLCRDWPPHQTAFRIWSAHFTSQRPNVGDTLGCIRSFPLRARLGFTMSVTFPALRPELVLLNRFPLVSPLSSTFSADCSAPQPLFKGFTGTIGLSDFPQPFIAVVLLRFTARTSRCHPTRPVRGISRFSCIELPRMLRVSDSAGPVHNSLTISLLHRVAFPTVAQGRHPGRVISELNGWPTLSPVNASRAASRLPAHDSGP